ncbi:MAG TPA: hypothetical protein VGL72_22210 [Bryobacteraceae bacterium]
MPPIPAPAISTSQRISGMVSGTVAWITALLGSPVSGTFWTSRTV